MPVLQLGPDDGLYYEYDAAPDGGATFVFVNAITGDTGMWQAEVAPALRAKGHGTLCYNFRGQAKSPYASGLRLDDTLIAGDLRHLVEALKPARPIPVGLSIGGLYAMQAHLAGLQVAGLVLLNTLRVIGPRIQWINAATLRCMEVGGPELMRDMMTPLLSGEAFQAANRQQFLKPDTVYEPLAKDSGSYNLIQWMGAADWEVGYEAITAPTLIMMGHQDRVFYDAEVVARLFARIPKAQRVDVPDAGHMLPVEAPQAVVEACAKFAAEV